MLAFAFPALNLISAYTISSVTAQEQGDFVLGPGKQEIIADPGETITKYITVTNRINQTVEFKVGVEDFIGSHDANTPVILLGDDTSPYSFKDKIKPEVDTFSLKFGERIVLPIEITIPENAQPGGYYASVLISSLPAKETDQASDVTASKTKIISRLGSLFFIRVRGPVNENGQLEDFKIQGPRNIIYPTAPGGFEILFENKGTVHLVPYGLITIRNMLGKTVARLPVDAYFSLPDSLRYREIVWTDPGFHLGRYTATLELNRGYGDIIDTKKVAFWVIPWKILIPIVVIVVSISLVIYYISTRFEFRRKK